MTGSDFSRCKSGLALTLALVFLSFAASKGEAHPFQDGNQVSEQQKIVPQRSPHQERPTAPSALKPGSPGINSLLSPAFPTGNELKRSSSAQSKFGFSANSQVQFNQPPLSPRGAPGNRKGGGTRDGHSCLALEIEEHLTALVPAFESKQLVKQVWGLTAAASPSLWFYLPYLPQDVVVGELEVWDETDREPRNYQQIYQGAFAVTGTPGTIGLGLPPTVNLEMDKNYHWYLSINVKCNAANEWVNVSGWIQRIKFNISFSAQKQSVEREQVILYSQNGIWYDTLTLLAQLRRRRPEAEILVADWAKLLGDVGLEELASKAIAPCCTLEQSLWVTK